MRTVHSRVGTEGEGGGRGRGTVRTVHSGVGTGGGGGEGGRGRGAIRTLHNRDVFDFLIMLTSSLIHREVCLFQLTLLEN